MSLTDSDSILVAKKSHFGSRPSGSMRRKKMKIHFLLSLRPTLIRHILLRRKCQRPEVEAWLSRLPDADHAG